MTDRDSALLRAMPVVFVLIWSTGFVVARFGMPHAPPMHFLAWRYALSIAAFGIWIGLSRTARRAWPQGRRQWLHLAVVGVLMHAGYLGGVWSAVRAGMGAGLVALIVGLQPIGTALWLTGRSRTWGTGLEAASAAARIHITPRQWVGLCLGLVGLVLVVAHKLGAGQATALNLSLAVLALASITAGTLYQKRWVQPCDVRTANTVQLMAALAVTAPLAGLEAGTFDLHPELIGAMAWSVLVLTLGGSSLLYLMIQRGAATAVASLMYLVPPCTAVLAAWLFREELGVAVIGGLVLTAIGVLLVVRAPGSARGRATSANRR
ncbi:MAG: DMT family transporter [Rubrivivax sp.]